MIFSNGRTAAWNALGRPTGRGVRVGIIGSGYDQDRPDPRVLPGIGFVDPDDDLEELRTTDDHDRIGHGTACARLVLGVAPDAGIVPIRVYGNHLESSPRTLHAALLWAVEQRLDVVCLSARLRYEGTIRPMYAVCEKGRRDGMIFVAGGIPDEGMTNVAEFEPVVGVRAGSFDSPLHFRYYPDYAYEMEAWGEEEIVKPDEAFGLENHPDYAAAVAAGIVALLRECYPGAPIERIRELLPQFAL